MKKRLFTLLLMLIAGGSLFAQFYAKTDKPKGRVTYPADRLPSSFELFSLNKTALASMLSGAPDLFSGETSNVNVTIPLPGNRTEVFSFYRTHPMSPKLENKAPDIKTYRGVSEKGHVIRLQLSPFGISWTVYHLKKGRAVLQRYDNANTYIYYYMKDQPAPDFACEISENIPENLSNQSQRPAFSDQILRKFRLAFAADGEFSQFHVQRAINNGDIPSNATDAQKKQAVLNAIVAVVDRVNEIYEVDLGIKLELIGNELSIIYLDPNTDPYTNNNSSQLLVQNQNNLDNVIGSSNYDIGHVGTTGGGGLAYRGAVCQNGIKAKGETGLNAPVGDSYAVDFVAHEMGHQFGGNHTFANYCGGNRNNGTAVEPGSGTTIMAYAGVCAPNVQDHSDPYFHDVSIREIKNYILLHDCSVHVNLTNNTPTVTAGPDKWIPKDTPFVIEVQGNDADAGDVLTYTWDQTDVYNDPGQTNAPPSSTNTSGPMFRSLPATQDNYRFFPRIEDVLNGSYGNTWEVLPTVDRILSFTVIVRDNVTPGGQIGRDDIVLGIKSSAGPFRITSQTSDEQWQPGSTHTVTWNVAGTDANSINCTAVDILLSTDGGFTYPVTLATNTPNDGSETITLPANVQTPTGRIMVKAHDNYFFDVNRGNLMIGNYQNICNSYSNNTAMSIPDNDPNGITSTIQINDNNTIQDLNVHIDISHTYIQDLKVSLTSPQGTTVRLFDRNCGAQHNLNITFDDSGQNLDCGATGAGNTYRPVDNLSAFNGESTQGTWTLTVSDNENQDTGTLNSWSIEACYLTAVNEIPVSNLKIYPVPAGDYLHIDFDAVSSSQHIIVTDINGRVLFDKTYRQTGAFKQNLNTSKWAPGIYMVTIIDGNRKSTGKITKD